MNQANIRKQITRSESVTIHSYKFHISDDDNYDELTTIKMDDKIYEFGATRDWVLKKLENLVVGDIELDWSTINNKPFISIDDNTLKVIDGTLQVISQGNIQLKHNGDNIGAIDIITTGNNITGIKIGDITYTIKSTSGDGGGNVKQPVTGIYTVSDVDTLSFKVDELYDGAYVQIVTNTNLFLNKDLNFTIDYKTKIISLLNAYAIGDVLYYTIF